MNRPVPSHYYCKRNCGTVPSGAVRVRFAASLPGCRRLVLCFRPLGRSLTLLVLSFLPFSVKQRAVVLCDGDDEYITLHPFVSTPSPSFFLLFCKFIIK